jgi:hypothetical protein
MLNFKFNKTDLVNIFSCAFLTVIILIYQLNLFPNYKNIFIPLGYGGDGLFHASVIKNFGNWNSFEERFNYPFGSDLSNGYLLSDKFLIFINLIIYKFSSNIHFSINITYIIIHLLAGIFMYSSCRLINCDKFISLLFSLSFSLTPMIFTRGIGHLTVGMIFVIPIAIIMIYSLYNIKSDKILNKEKVFYFFTISILSIGNIYYFYLSILLLFFLLLLFYFEKNYYKAKITFFVIFIGLFIFFICNITFFTYAFSGNSIVGRNIPSYEIYGLKLPDLFLKSGYHKISLFSEVSNKIYYDLSYIKGEPFAFMGFVGILCFIILFFHSFIHFSKHKKFFLGNFNFQMVFVIIFSLIGGVNLVLAILDLSPARATNRYSGWILCISIIYVCFFLTKIKTKYLVLNCKNYFYYSLVILTLIILDLPKPLSDQQILDTKTILYEDINLINYLEKKKEKIKLAILPHMNYPENGPIEKIIDYDPARIYINSKNIFLSYGKNRYEDNGPRIPLGNDYDLKKSILLFKHFNYDYLILNKKGYKKETFKKNYEWLKLYFNEENIEHRDYVLFSLKTLTYLEEIHSIYYLSGWSQQEPNWRWSLSNTADLLFLTNNKKNRNINFKLQSFGPKSRIYKIYVNNTLIQQGIINNSKKEISLSLNVNLIKENFLNLRIKVDGKKYTAGPNDKRKITFAIHDLKIF